MRLHGIALFIAAMAALILTPSSVSANTILDIGSAADETTSDPIQLLPSDIVTDSPAPFFGALDGAAATQSAEADFLSPELLSLEPGSFPPYLYGTQEILNPVPEPGSMRWITCSLLTIAWIGGRKRP
jgi:hypothetical protein